MFIKLYKFIIEKMVGIFIYLIIYIRFTHLSGKFLEANNICIFKRKIRYEAFGLANWDILCVNEYCLKFKFI